MRNLTLNFNKTNFKRKHDVKIVKISIIVICKNSINTIKNSLNSVINQTYQDFELIVVDGNSSDGTKEFLSSKKNIFLN